MLLFTVVLFFIFVTNTNAAFAQGSAQLVFHAPNGRSSELYPLKANLSSLWCQAVVDGPSGEIKRLSIAEARFLHYRPDKSYIARVDNDKAFLDLGEQSISAAGKYKCQITTRNGEFVHGNMFIFLRPVLHSDGTSRFTINDDSNGFELTGPSVRVEVGEEAVLVCPAIGYPIPEIRWYKDHTLIDQSDRHTFLRNELRIRDVDDSDEGTYRCIATNEFPVHTDGEHVLHEVILDQVLRVSGNIGWLVPLIVIIIILILLFVTIYTCTWWSRRGARKSYNVAEQEKSIMDIEKGDDH